MIRDGKAGKGWESQKTCLNQASLTRPSWQKVVRVKVLCFYPQLSYEGRGFFVNNRAKGKGNKAKGLQRTGILILLATCILLLIHYTLLTPASYAGAPARIVSLSPGTTEILFAAGLGDNIVGVTSFCDYPEEAKKKPKIGGMSNPSLEAVFSLKPDIVIMTTDGNPKEFNLRLQSLGIKTYVFRARTIPELPDGIRKMGAALDEEESFNALALDIEEALERVKQNKSGRGEKVIFVIWPEPLIVAGPGTEVDDAINILGAVNIAGNADMEYPKYSLEEILRRSPDIIFIGEGKGMEEVSSGLLKRLSSLKVVKTGKVYFVSDHLYRLGPRVIEGIEELSQHIEGSEDSRVRGFE
jgi:iron complex transport system substrate-binding protein